MIAKKENPTQQATTLHSFYIPANFSMLRAPALPADLFLMLTADEKNADGDDDTYYEEVVRNCYQKLQELASQAEIEHALAIASLSLQEGIKRVDHGNYSKQTKRVYSRLLRYIVRMCTRPTPFGLFAGIAIGEFGEQNMVQLAAPTIHSSRTRPDMHWLFEIIRQVEQVPEVVAQLHVVANQTVHLAGGRAVLPFADIYGQSDNRTLSLRATPTLLFVLEHARQPILYTDLRTMLQEAFPRASLAQVERLLWQLWENHFLLSDLRPPFTHEAPENYVIEHLNDVKGVETVLSGLQVVAEKARQHSQAGWSGSMALLQEIVEKQRSLVPDSKAQQLQIQVDASLHLNMHTLHNDIGALAAQTAEVLLRLSPLSRGTQTFQSYIAAFTEHYGAGQEVPLLELLSPELGLDVPSGYQNPGRSYPLRIPEQAATYPEYNRVLHSLAMQAVNAREIEIELTDTLLQQLERWSPKRDEAPPSLEIYFQLHAASQEEMNQGKWQAVVGPNCGSSGAGRSFGRFSNLMSMEQRESLQQLIQSEEALYPNKIFAELSYMPNHSRLINVAVQSGVRTYEIAVGVTPSVPLDHVLPLEDLVVGVRNNRFYIRSQRLGKEVIVRQNHMLNPMNAPTPCRFLLDCGTNGFAGLSSFDWGTASTLPFLPRVRYKQVILSPAQWHLSSESIVPTGSGSERARWFAGLQQWRATWRVPRYVYLAFMDNRLLLDLEHPLLATELYTELAKLAPKDTVTLEELLPDFDHLWLEDNHGSKYFSEIVIPLIRTGAQVEQKSASPEYVSPPPDTLRVLRQQERRIYPGDTWVYFKLYSAYKQHDELIASPLRDLVRTIASEALVDRWFYMRYCDSAPHLRIRFHAHNELNVPQLLTIMLTWCRQQVERGLASDFSINTYEPEIERYGGPDTIEMIEQAFTADSVTTSNLVTACYNRQISIDPIAMAIFSLDRFFIDWGLDFASRLQWAQDHIKKEPLKEFHALRNTYCDLLSPWQHTKDATLMEQRELLCKLVELQKPVIEAVSTHVRAIGDRGELWMPEDSILRSLIHMHINRLLDHGFEKEPRIYALWRLTLESLSLRPENRKTSLLRR